MEKFLVVTVYFFATFVQVNNLNHIISLNQSPFLACTAESTLRATHTVQNFTIWFEKITGKFFFNKEIQGTLLPFHLEREFKKYLTCGNLAFGMARFHCSLCQKDKLVAFSFKGRTLCPSCTGRRMSDTAKPLIEEVIQEVPWRFFTGHLIVIMKTKQSFTIWKIPKR